MQIANEAAVLLRDSVQKQKPSSTKLVTVEEGADSDGIMLQSKVTATVLNQRKPEKLQPSKEARSLRIKEIHKRFRDKRRETETPEKAAERRAKAAEAARRKRRQAKEAALTLGVKQFTTEPVFSETAIYENTVLEQFSTQSVVLSVDEKTEARRLKMREYNRRFREKRRAVETPEQTAARRAKLAEWMRMTRLIAKEKKLLGTAQQYATAPATAEQTLETLPSSSSKDHMPEYFHSHLSKSQTAAQETVTKAIACKQEFDANSLGCSTSTWSSECSFSIKTESESYPPAQQNPNEAVTVKNEYSQDSWSCYQGSESSFLTQDNTDFEPTTNLEGYPRANDAILPGNFHRAQTADFVPDEHSTYGAYIADRFYNANRNKSEDNVAQMLIESVMLNLLSGIYGYSINFVEADEVGQKEEAPSLPTQLTNKPTVNAVVVKEEVDL